MTLRAARLIVLPLFLHPWLTNLSLYALAVAVPQTNISLSSSTHQLSPPKDLTATLPPSAFAISTIPTSSTTALPTHTVFALAIQALLSFVSLPFASFIPRGKVLRLPSYPGYALHIRGPSTVPAGAFEIKYAIWGVALAANYMVDQNAFRDFDFEWKWLGKPVGSLRFIVDKPRAGAVMIGNQDLGVQGDDSTLNITTSGAASYADVEVSFRPISGPFLPFPGTMMTLISGLTDCAPYPALQPLSRRVFTTSWPRYPLSFILNNYHVPEQEFNYNFVAIVLGRTAGWFLVTDESSRGVSVLVRYRGEIVAGGTLSMDPRVSSSRK